MGEQVFIGVDVGGTRIKTAAVTPAGRVVLEDVAPTPHRPGAGVVPLVAGLVADTAQRLADDGHEVAAAGVVVPGIVDDIRGIAHYSANLGWRDLPLAEELRAAVSIPCVVGRDVRAGLVGEHRFGAAQGLENVLFVPLGTGIAAATLHRGQLGADGSAGEIGHVVVEPGGPECGCGTRGCLEVVAGARAIGLRFAERIGLEATAVSAVDVARLVADPAYVRQGAAGLPPQAAQVAAGVWSQAIAALTQVLTPILVATGSSTLLVGGGLALAGDVLTDPLERAIHDHLGAGITVDVRTAALSDRAGALGAAVLAMRGA